MSLLRSKCPGEAGGLVRVEFGEAHRAPGEAAALLGYLHQQLPGGAEVVQRATGEDQEKAEKDHPDAGELHEDELRPSVAGDQPEVVAADGAFLSHPERELSHPAPALL